MGSQRTDIRTQLLLGGDTIKIYNASLEDVRITLRLESAGPCVIGTNANLLPVGSSTGQLLPSDGKEVSFVLSRGAILYAGSDTPQRLSYRIEPIPYLIEILNTVAQVAQGLYQVVQAVLGRSPTNKPPGC